jgi:hypothetical protein
VLYTVVSFLAQPVRRKFAIKYKRKFIYTYIETTTMKTETALQMYQSAKVWKIVKTFLWTRIRFKQWARLE